MKKVSIFFCIIGSIFLAFTYYFMQKSTRLITKSEQAALKLEAVLTGKIPLPKKSIIPDIEGAYYYYENMDLAQKEHIMINDCMQYYINDESFDNGNRCEELIVDAVIKNMGESEFIEAIIGSAINYKSEVSIKDNLPKMFFDTETTEAPLKSKLILTFLNRYRDPIKMQTAFNAYKEYFLDNISENLYNKLFQKYLNTFIESYEEINSQEDKESFYKKIYYEAETKNRHSEFWKYTFWKRRELEKNDQVIYAILKEIKSHYEL